MPKRKTLNGLPHNLTKSLFGTERYYKCGYMADWIWNGARRYNISVVVIDVLNGSLFPPQLNIHPLLFHVADLKGIIVKELSANEFPEDFITEAIIRIEIPTFQRKELHCYPSLVDKDGRRFEPGRLIEFAYEDFDPFDCYEIASYLAMTGAGRKV